MAKKGEFSTLFENRQAKGYKQVRVDGHTKNLFSDFVLIKTNKHDIECYIDKLSVSSKDLKDKVYMDNLRSRLTDSIEQALKLSEGLVILSEITDKALTMPEFPKEFMDHLFSEKFSCPVDNISLPEIEPRTFSFNTPHGACVRCNGIGRILEVDPELVFSEEISVTEGGILPFANTFEHDTWLSRLMLTFCHENKIDARTPIQNLTEEQKKLLLEGTGDREYKVKGTNRFGKMTYIYEKFTGVINELQTRYHTTDSDWAKREIEKYMRDRVCPECGGTRLKKEALAITINKLPISEVTKFSIEDTYEWIQKILADHLSSKERKIGEIIIKEISERLNFLISVGLNYLTLERSAATLSGGEAQRIRLASQIGSGLTGILYVLDEPTIGLHQRDNQKLIDTLKKLKSLGNTVVVVEHDSQTILESDYVVDFGPSAGKLGGKIIAEGSPKELMANSKSLTGSYLSGKKKIGTKMVLPEKLMRLDDNKKKEIVLTGCSQFNLKNVTVTFPLGKLLVITGVSGSGKSTLLVETLYPALESILNKDFKGEVGAHKDVSGLENIDKVILIDQSPIGRTPRSNPATYTKIFDHIRDVYAETREAKAMGFKKGRFSFNVKGGRCEECEGQGQTKIEMQFMSDIWITCEVCGGSRYNSQTLEVSFKGKNIADVLKMNITEAMDFFHAHRHIYAKLETLKDVGLDYMELGQSATTLSGGEAQRIKLAAELSKKDTGKTLYILDEPTTGLHFADVEKLLQVLKILVSRGNSVFVIEHNLDIIKNADHIIDLGPEGGDMGGQIIAQGSVSEIIANKISYTGKYLKELA